jgi:hypothetical protein
MPEQFPRQMSILRQKSGRAAARTSIFMREISHHEETNIVFIVAINSAPPIFLQLETDLTNAVIHTASIAS